MADRIESGDALIVDESKTYINSGKVYAFVYDSELFCKQLKKTANSITAISFNKEYEPFEIDKTKQFAIVCGNHDIGKSRYPLPGGPPSICRNRPAGGFH